MIPAAIKNVELVNIRQLPWVNGGHVYIITDLLAGLKYNIIGEHNNARHADYVCASREDTAIKLQTANGNFRNNWGARPCILTIGDRHFAAATHNAAHAPHMSHLRNPADIGHEGHFCVWVLEAQTGGSEEYRRSMLAAVQQAYEMARGMGLVVESSDKETFLPQDQRQKPPTTDGIGALPPARLAQERRITIEMLGDLKEVGGYIEDGITYVRMRELAEMLGYCVTWGEGRRLPIISRDDRTEPVAVCENDLDYVNQPHTEAERRGVLMGLQRRISACAGCPHCGR